MYIERLNRTIGTSNGRINVCVEEENYFADHIIDPTHSIKLPVFLGVRFEVLILSKVSGCPEKKSLKS